MSHRFAFPLVLLALLLPDPAGACSRSRVPSQRVSTGTYFLAAATPDTAHAGPGTATYYASDPRVEPALERPPRPIYGQVVRLERIGGFLADSVRRLAASQGGEVVVVPWGYRADCRPIAWTESARWVPAGARGVYIARLRPREHWAGDRPTFDVSSGWETPYPHGRFLDAAKLPRDSVLSAEQFFSFYAALPEAGALERDPEAALRPLRQWVREHPALASRVPVPEGVEGAAVSAEYARVARITPEVAGTYRLVVTAEGEAPRELFIRTSRRATPWFGGQGYQGMPAPEAALERRAVGYQLLVHAAETEAGIPATNRDAWNSPPCTPSGLTVVAEPARTDAGVEVWPASLDWGMFQRCFPDHGAAARAVEVVGEQLRDGSHERLPGRFLREPDGSIRFEQTLRVSGSALIRITGERVSTEARDPR